MTYAAPVFVRARFMNAGTGEIKEQTVFMGDFPVMTRQGHVHRQRHERVVVSQLVRSPASSSNPDAMRRRCSRAPSTPTAASGSSSTSRPSRPGRHRRVPCRTQAPAVPVRAAACSRVRGPGLPGAVRPPLRLPEAQWEKEQNLAPTREEALLEIYKRARPGEPLSVEAARQYFENAFFNPKRYDLTRVGRYKLNRKLGPEIERISDILKIDLERPSPTQGVLSPSEILLLDLHAPSGQAHGRQ